MFLRNSDWQLSVSLRIVWAVVSAAISIFLFEVLYGNAVVMLSVVCAMISVCWQTATLIGGNPVFYRISRHNFTIYIYSRPFQAVVMFFAVRPFSLDIQQRFVCFYRHVGSNYFSSDV